MLVEVKRGDIVLLKDSRLIAKLYEFITNKPVNHISLAITTNMLIIPMPIYGIEIKHIRGYEHYTVLRCKDITDTAINQIISYALDRVGKEYNQGLIYKVRKKLNSFFKYGINTQDQWMCTNIINKAFLYAGVELLPGFTGNCDAEDLIASGLLYQVEEDYVQDS